MLYMLHDKLINPNSIVVIGGSDNIHSPGGSVLKNLLDHKFKGELFVINPKKEVVQGVKSYSDITTLPEVDLAIIAIAAQYVVETVRILTIQKNTKGFIIFSAGFSEKDAEGTAMEQEIVSLITNVGGSLLGPNNIGLINKHYAGVFTSPIPKLNPKGVDFISGSGATAVFIIEAAQRMGLTFSSVYTVGNSAQLGVEEVLEHFDVTYDANKSSNVKLLYIESIKNPQKFLKHSTSLIQKGCSIAAIKAGSSEAGNRAASSHTGAMASPDVFVDALFKKAGIIRCYGRNELITVAGILLQKKAKGNNIAIITHAGGPAVMLTDILSKNGLSVPKIGGKESEELLTKLFNGSSVSNPIDFLATGTAEQLETIIDYCENKFDMIDAMAVIFGSPGLTDVYDAYNVLNTKMKTCNKPIYPILPSVVNVKDEIADFIAKGNVAFDDEVLFGSALGKVYQTSTLQPAKTIETIDTESIQQLISTQPDGFLSPKATYELLQLAGIPMVEQYTVSTNDELQKLTATLPYPVVMKVVGLVHKSDVGGVVLNVKDETEAIKTFVQLIQIDRATSVLIQPMQQGMELFIGAKREPGYPPIVLCGLGGIFVEVLKDVSTAMVPISEQESLQMIQHLKAYPMLQGIRGKKGIDINSYAGIIRKIGLLMQIAPEIMELDLNPLLATEDKIVAVDARIRIEK